MTLHPLLLPFVLLAAMPAAASAAVERPNVMLIITDDQGYGDVGAHGNEMIRTPHLDRLHAESIRLTDYHVDPTCSPTRSALMTGRYSTRTGVWHTIQGRSLMAPTELTLGETFAANGYRTGMFGKWHLGDNYPCRPQDQGFQTTVHHGGGGVTQTPDWWGNDYFDDTYLHEDGTPKQFDGYCTDVWFRQALKFVEQAKEADKPFFCYLATNAPHGPFLVADEYKQPYLDAGVPPTMAAFYGMITNIDENVGRLMQQLDDWDLADDTVLIFTTDNGTAAGVARPPRKGRKAAEAAATWSGFNNGMRGQKGSEYDGGHRVPFFIRWPDGKLQGGRDVGQLAAHVDVLPTLVELCGLKKPDGPPVDGRSLVAALRGESASPLADRTLFVHSQRMEFVKKWHKSAVMTERWRLINGEELFDIQADAGQVSNVASAHADIVEDLRGRYEEWWESLSPVFDGYVRIGLGSEHEQPTKLTCHDWHTGDKPVPWNQGAVSRDPLHNGYWAVDVLAPGRYEFTLRMRPAQVTYLLPPGEGRVRCGEVEASVPVGEGDSEAVIEVELPAGPANVQTWLETTDGNSRGAYFVDVRRIEN